MDIYWRIGLEARFKSPRKGQRRLCSEINIYLRAVFGKEMSDGDIGRKHHPL